MSNQISLGDPGTNNVWTFSMPMPDRSGGYVVIINESPYGLTFTLPMGTGNVTFRVPSDSWRQVTINGPIVGLVTWGIVNRTNTSAAPISDVAVECYALDECPNTTIGIIGRQTNLGNSVPVGTQATQVVNDGNGAPSLVVEGTPSGALASQLKWNNDGSGVFGGGNGSVDNTGKFTLPAGALPVASLGAGAVPAGVSVPVANLSGAGALPAGATLAGSQVTGTLPAAQVGSGYPAAQVANPPWVNKAGDSMSAALAVVQALAGSNKNFLILDASDEKSWNIGVDTSGDVFFYNATDGINALSIGPTGVIVANGRTLIGLSVGGSLTGIAAISGSGSATVNHGLSATPDAAVVNTANGSNSTTFGSGSYTSSTVFIYQFNAQAWKGVVYKS